MSEIDLVTLVMKYTYLIIQMFVIGMTIHPGEARSVLNDIPFFIKALALNLIGIPLIALFIIMLFIRDSDIAAALWLLAAAPGGLSVMHFASRVKGKKPLAAFLLILLSLSVLFITPLLTSLAPAFNINLAIPWLNYTGMIVLCLILPVLAGYGFQYRASSEIVEGLSSLLGAAATALFIILALVLGTTAFKSGAEFVETGGLMTFGVFIVICMTAGWFLGGKDRNSRRILASVSGYRNIAFALLVSSLVIPSRHVDEAVLAYGYLLIPFNFVFQYYHMLKNRKRVS